MPDRKRRDEPMDDQGPLPRRDVRSTEKEEDAKKRQAPPRDPHDDEREPEEPHGPSGAV